MSTTANNFHMLQHPSLDIHMNMNMTTNANSNNSNSVTKKKKKKISSKGSTRRGSSVFAAQASEQTDLSGPYGRPAYLSVEPEPERDPRSCSHFNDLLVDFPQYANTNASTNTNTKSRHKTGSMDMNVNVAPGVHYGHVYVQQAHPQAHPQSQVQIGFDLTKVHEQSVSIEKSSSSRTATTFGSTSTSAYKHTSAGDASVSSHHQFDPHNYPSSSSGSVSSHKSSTSSSTRSRHYQGGGGHSNHHHQNHNKSRRLGEAARMMELSNSQDLPGGKNHRPLVGGFAAAAYEAAKAHHYSNKRTSSLEGGKPRDRPAPPSI